MRTKHDVKWLAHYNELRIYLEEHHQLPDKKRTENRALLNWWKYNKKLFKAGQLTEERLKLLLTSSSCHPKIFVKEFSYFLMSCHQHCLGVNLLVQR